MKDRETRQKNRREKRTDEKLTLNTKLVLVIAGSLLLAVGLFFVWLKTTVDISLILGNLITVIVDYQIPHKPLKILSL